MDNYVITISRKFASNGHAVALRVSDMLGIPVYDRSAVEARVRISGDDVQEVRQRRSGEETDTDSRQESVGLFKGLFHREAKEEIQDEAQIEFESQCEVIRSLAEEGSCIIIGRCADDIFRDHPRALHVFIFASDDVRLKNSMEMLHTGEAEARALIQNEDRAREAYRRRFCASADDEIKGRHLLIDTGRIGVEHSARILAQTAEYLFL